MDIQEHTFDTGTVINIHYMDVILPAIQCPMLLLQAAPRAGGVMTDTEIQQAWPLLAHPSHVRLDGVSHVLHNENKEAVVSALKTFL